MRGRRTDKKTLYYRHDYWRFNVFPRTVDPLSWVNHSLHLPYDEQKSFSLFFFGLYGDVGTMKVKKYSTHRAAIITVFISGKGYPLNWVAVVLAWPISALCGPASSSSSVPHIDVSGVSERSSRTSLHRTDTRPISSPFSSPRWRFQNLASVGAKHCQLTTFHIILV